MSTPTNSFPAQTTIAASDTFLMNVSASSAKVTGANVISNLGLPTLAGTNTWTGVNSLSGSVAFIQLGINTGADKRMTVTWDDGAGHVTCIYSYTGDRELRIGASPGAGFSDVRLGLNGVVTGDSNPIGFSSNFNANGNPDTAIGRAAANVLEANNGTGGGGAAFQLNEMTAPAGAANSARLFTQDLAGKTQLMVQFGSGAAQQIAIEL